MTIMGGLWLDESTCAADGNAVSIVNASGPPQSTTSRYFER